MKSYNGHRSWNAWNVCLWIHNDYGLYQLALECKAQSKTLGRAACMFMGLVGAEKTSDGAKYNKTCVREALRDLT